MSNKTLAFVLAGGKGTRLEPLTADRAKPAVPFGGKYRIIDFVLSNLLNSEIYGIYVLTQFKSPEPDRAHERRPGTSAAILPGHFIVAVPGPAAHRRPFWYKGTADAIYQNLNLIKDRDPEPDRDLRRRPHLQDERRGHDQASTSASHRRCHHRRDPGADRRSNQFGVIQVDSRLAHHRLPGEARANPTPIPGQPGNGPGIDGQLPVFKRARS